MANGGSPKEPNYVPGFPKTSQLSPVLRTNHMHYNNEASGEYKSLIFCRKVLLRCLYNCHSKNRVNF